MDVYEPGYTVTKKWRFMISNKENFLDLLQDSNNLVQLNYDGSNKIETHVFKGGMSEGAN